MLQLFSFPHFASFEKKFYNALNFLNTIFDIIAQHIFDFHETSTYLSVAERKIGTLPIHGSQVFFSFLDNSYETQ